MMKLKYKPQQCDSGRNFFILFFIFLGFLCLCKTNSTESENFKHDRKENL